MILHGEGKKTFKLSPGDAFVIPPKMKTQYTEYTPELELLEVSLPESLILTTNLIVWIYKSSICNSEKALINSSSIHYNWTVPSDWFFDGFS